MRTLAPLAALLVWAPIARSQSLLEREDPHVTAANQAYAKGKYDEALRGYEDAEREGAQGPQLAFDRGNALYKLGRRDEARQAYLTALGAPDGSLKVQDYFNLGNALWDLDRKDEAAQAFERALILDPGFDDARHNLELLLEPPPPQDGGPPDGGQGDGGSSDGGSPKGPPDGGNGDGGGGDGGTQSPKAGADGGATDAGQGDGGSQSPKPDERDGGQKPNPLAQRPDGGAGNEHNQKEAKAAPLDEQQAEQLLDALRQREKNLQLWKFRLKHQRAKDVDKDW